MKCLSEFIGKEVRLFLDDMEDEAHFCILLGYDQSGFLVEWPDCKYGNQDFLPWHRLVSMDNNVREAGE